MDSYSNLIARINNHVNFASANHIKIVKVERGYAEAELTVAPESLNPIGIVHGGCLATLADTVTGTAAHTHGKIGVTLDCTLSFLAPATGRKIRGVSHVLKAGRTIIVCDVELFDEAENKVATGTFTFYMKDKPIPNYE